MFGLSKAERDEEFTRFVQQSQGSLSGTAWLLTGNREAAADLVQAALVKTYAAWPRVRRDDALGYARRVLINENIDRWRSLHGEVVDDQPAGWLSISDGSDDRADHDAMVRMLRQLPAGQRKVIVLRYFCDMSERDIAATLDISTGAVKSAASRGLATLRTLHAEGAAS